jgi:hypothetical protein
MDWPKTSGGGLFFHPSAKAVCKASSHPGKCAWLAEAEM